nr:MAG TPA: hypothetical protein [Caudoviricetes sp.]
MNSAFTIMFLIAIIVAVALMISICIAGTVFLLEETGMLDVFREIVHKKKCQPIEKFNTCDTNPDCKLEPMKCSFAVEYSTWEEANNGTRKFMCGCDKCKYQK